MARTRQQLVEEGFEAVPTRKHSPASARKRIFDGAAEAKLVAVACSKPPTGRARWTLKPLEEAVVELNIVERASDNTISRTLKKRSCPFPPQKQWVIPPDANAAFVASTEDVLEVYHRPRDPACPVVCVDETSKQLIAETRVPIPAKLDTLHGMTYEYQRNGTANLFMIFAPLEGWRHVKKVTDRHAAADYAHILKELSNTHFPEANKIVLVQDNLNTHRPASPLRSLPCR